MITRDDWNDALDAWVDEERERLGGPPSREEVTAYLRGDLPPAEAARVRALLVYYPELTPLLNARAPKPRRPRALQFYAVAATLSVALLATDAVRQRARNAQPVVPSAHVELDAVLTRSGAATDASELRAGEARYLLTLVPPERPAASDYEIEIARDARVLWSRRGVRPIDDTFVIDVPGAFLEPGTYTLHVFTGGRMVARYALRVTR